MVINSLALGFKLLLTYSLFIFLSLLDTLLALIESFSFSRILLLGVLLNVLCIARLSFFQFLVECSNKCICFLILL